MPPIVRTQREEDDFMNDLLHGFDNPAGLRDGVAPHTQNTSKSVASKPLYNSNRVSPAPPQIRTSPKTPVKRRVERLELEQLLEGAEEWDWDDMNADFLSPMKPKSPKKSAATPILSAPDYRPETCTRCVVRKIDESFCGNNFQKSLIVEVVGDNQRRSVVLRDDWVDAHVRIGDVANVIGEFEHMASSSSLQIPTITINSKSNLFIHHPDLLITATSLSSAPQCRRKPLISNLVRGSVDMTPSLVWGNMLHEVMQECLRSRRWDQKWIEEKISEEIDKGLGELMRVNMSAEQAMSDMKARAQGLKSFAEKYIAEEPKKHAVLNDARATQGQSSLLAIRKTHDIEEDMWSPTYGLKGKIDASVNAVISEIDNSSNPFAKAAPRSVSQSWTLPFEIKTGRTVAGMEHRAQTMLYTLLMAERYNTEVPSGLLYYTRSDEVVRVPAARNEVRSLLVARNELAGYMMRRMRSQHEPDVKRENNLDDASEMPDLEAFLPPTIDDAWRCGNCYALDICMLYRKAVENVVDTTSPIADIYALKTSHLTEEQAAFFRKWEALIALEEQDLVRFKKELWTMGAQERERHGRCFSDMILDTSILGMPAGAKMTSQSSGKIHRFTYHFIKSSRTPEGSLLNGHMSLGDAITISVEPNMLAMARGFIVELTPRGVTVGVDHEVNLDTILALTKHKRHNQNNVVVFRIDKDELFAGMGRIRDNLAQLFYVDGDTRRLRLVVDLVSPCFEEHSENDMQAISRLSIMAKLNASQRKAATKVLTARDYALILGMPGTGKTTVIAAIIQQLVRMGKTVLLASYTHSAVDTILLKLKDVADFGILRLGNLDKIHPNVHEYTLAHRRIARNIDQLEQQVMTPPVIATTCLSLDHPLFSRRKFDYCIVDEASQITLPTCLGPLRFADKFVLVGDHFQLPPLVRNRSARKGGLDVSLFRRLSDAHPHAVVDLTEQYRMNADIMLLSNKLIYNDRLRCGSEAIATRSLALPDPTFIRGLHACGAPCQYNEGKCWLDKLLRESCKAVFVDTDAVPAHDSPVGDLVENPVEADLVHQVTECLIQSGVQEEQIGVLSLYRQQIKLLSYKLQNRKGIEVLTADRSQGRDKDCIIISMVRSNDEGQVGDLMKDWRRMNVSFTRARSKLIVFGSRKTLQSTPLLKQFFELMESRAWILTLSPHAHEMHSLSSPASKKRPAEDVSIDTASVCSKENTTTRPSKRDRRTITGEGGLLRGRPILKELANASE